MPVAVQYLCSDIAIHGHLTRLLTLQAACGAFAVDVHVISTETEHFHLEYACPVPSAATPRKLFLSYISPIHYNVVVPNK